MPSSMVTVLRIQREGQAHRTIAQNDGKSALMKSALHGTSLYSIATAPVNWKLFTVGEKHIPSESGETKQSGDSETFQGWNFGTGKWILPS